MNASSSRPTIFTLLGWACFLACSWTWCIGMFLPVFLRRDFGLWSWLAFLLPNIVGAAVMGGWVLTPERSRRFVHAHAHAAVLFSAVTIAFQWFFFSWLLMRFGFTLQTGLIFGLGVGAIFALRDWTQRPGPTRVLAMAVFAASLAMGAWWLFSGSPPHPGAVLPPPLRPQLELLPLGAVCVLGFALCPYLDLTFHHVRQRLDGAAGTTAFVIGFMALFPLMIQFTSSYAPGIIQEAIENKVNIAPGLAALPIVLHMALQLGFTIGAHEEVINSDRAGGSSLPVRVPSWLALSAMIVGVAMVFVATRSNLRLNDMGGTELIYRGFMSFYGLVFPAYIAIAALGTRAFQRPSPGLLILVGVVVLLGAPAFWMAFIERQTWWALAAVGVVLVGAILSYLRGGSTPPELHGAPVPPPPDSPTLAAKARVLTRSGDS